MRHLLLACALVPSARFAVAAPPPDRTLRRIENRVQLWSTHADGTRPLAARFELVRHTALLREPYRATGSFSADPSGAIAFVGDDTRCATTRISPDGTVSLALPSGGTRPIDAPSARWLANLLRRLFVPAEETRQALVGNDRVRIPSGRGMRLEFRPPAPEDAPHIRAVTVHLDPVAGHVARIDVFEASGDRVEIRFHDVRRPDPQHAGRPDAAGGTAR
ncbi:MAG: hypothetical protein D6705_05845 [Deltaproteobacteria bacterium]|nr:MAG: hypothetical protein D6705_05845 [Deltaproteobacteria bacterium]